MIRFFKEEDREKYIEYSKAMYSSNAVSHNIPESNFENTFNDIMNGTPYAEGLAVEYNGEMVGYGLLSLSYSNEAGGKQMWLDELFIDERYRSHGLGKEFFEFAEKLHPDMKRFRLEVSVDNPRALNLYKRLGYDNMEYIQLYKDVKD